MDDRQFFENLKKLQEDPELFAKTKDEARKFMEQTAKIAAAYTNSTAVIMAIYKDAVELNMNLGAMKIITLGAQNWDNPTQAENPNIQLVIMSKPTVDLLLEKAGYSAEDA